MTGKVDSKNQSTQTNNEESVEDAYNYDDYLPGTEQPKNDGKTGSSQKTSSGYTQPTTKNLGTGTGTGGVAPGTDPGMPGGNQAAQNAMNQVNSWLSQGKSPEWIQQQLMSQGWSEGDAYYMSHGGSTAAYPNSWPTQYPYSNPPTKGLTYPNQNNNLMKFMMDAQQAQEYKNMAQDAKKNEAQQKVKIHMILLQILMGDITGAMRSYWILMDRDMRQFTRQIVDKLDKVRQARSTVIRNFARTKPPKTYAGKDAAQQARAQDKTSQYTQFVQMNTQLMNELQSTERELVDALQSMNRNMQTFAESYAGMRDQDARTSERIMTTR